MQDRRHLDALDAAKEVVIETSSGGRSHRTIIWVAVSGDVVYVRSVRGRAGRWFQRALAEPGVSLHVDGARLSFTATPATDEASVEQASAGFARKYPKSQSLAAMLRPEVLDTTLRLDPIDAPE